MRVKRPPAIVVHAELQIRLGSTPPRLPVGGAGAPTPTAAMPTKVYLAGRGANYTSATELCCGQRLGGGLVPWSSWGGERYVCTLRWHVPLRRAGLCASVDRVGRMWRAGRCARRCRVFSGTRSPHLKRRILATVNLALVPIDSLTIVSRTLPSGAPLQPALHAGQLTWLSRETARERQDRPPPGPCIGAAIFLGVRTNSSRASIPAHGPS